MQELTSFTGAAVDGTIELHDALTPAVLGIVDAAKYDVFLSYRVDSEKFNVEKLYNGLTNMGLKVYWDKKCLKPGEKWEGGELIESYIHSTHLFHTFSSHLPTHPHTHITPSHYPLSTHVSTILSQPTLIPTHLHFNPPSFQPTLIPTHPTTTPFQTVFAQAWPKAKFSFPFYPKKASTIPTNPGRISPN